MLRSILYQGRIYAGATRLSSTLQVEQTGPMQLTVRKGVLTDVAGTEHALEDDAVLDIPGPGEYAFLVGGQCIVFPFQVPEGCVDLAAIDIFVLTVVPGFPPGTTASDWKIQSGYMAARQS